MSLGESELYESLRYRLRRLLRWFDEFVTADQICEDLLNVGVDDPGTRNLVHVTLASMLRAGELERELVAGQWRGWSWGYRLTPEWRRLERSRGVASPRASTCSGARRSSGARHSSR